ncbi:oligosaccharide flippase family protein [Mesorhizobium sp. B4-1-4]|uniref:oligosaccharide flippase family protein n=1 Tax=Mesorhizobium sp. B4-1-4 TaxID=2589888 RepID=UPI001127D055|nr:oligosaccharide flippase family protein [Mesorhizobium sp. B4-1-4]UCI29357.1 oligosaccharide flippase family protein [Mesorhizobium sp. B4-1-4]
MNSVRKALVYTTADRYFGLAVNFGLTMVVSRLLTPTEIGISVTGSAIAGLALSLREFSSTAFIVQRPTLSREDVRAAFTVMMALTVLISAGLLLFAPSIAHVYGEGGLVPYLRLISAAILVEVVAAPILALMRRDMAFGRVALVNIAIAVSSAIIVVVLIALGFSYMSFAIAWLVSATVGGILALSLRREFWALKPLFSNWGVVIAFGSYNGLMAILARMYDQVPYLVLGRFLSFDAAGLFNRTLTVAQLPDKIFLASSVSVAFSGFSSEARNGGDLKTHYLTALAYATGVHWPALGVLAILAHPIVTFLYGDQWLEIVPLVRIAAIAAFFSFSYSLNYCILMAVGAIRDAFLRSLIIWPVCALALLIAAPFGLVGMVLTLIATVPFQALVSLLFVRRHISMTWAEFALALWKSAAVTIGSAAGPAVIAIACYPSRIGLAAAVAAVVLSCAGWVFSIWLFRHPAMHELGHVATFFKRIVRARRRRGLTLLTAAESGTAAIFPSEVK